jgi:hypothetical protein
VKDDHATTDLEKFNLRMQTFNCQRNKRIFCQNKFSVDVSANANSSTSTSPLGAHGHMFIAKRHSTKDDPTNLILAPPRDDHPGAGTGLKRRVTAIKHSATIDAQKSPTRCNLNINGTQFYTPH